MAAKVPLQSDAEHSELTGNDALIATALRTLADLVKKKKLKPTLVSVKHLTKLSINTIRGREWARKAIEDLKTAAKKEKAKQATTVETGREGDKLIIDPDVVLSRKLEGLLKQNGLLYEEILHLRREIRKRDETIENLQGARLKMM
jgi:hypothetical protein